MTTMTANPATRSLSPIHGDFAATDLSELITMTVSELSEFLHPDPADAWLHQWDHYRELEQHCDDETATLTAAEIRSIIAQESATAA